MAYKTDQCNECAKKCPPDVILGKLKKGRMPFGECLDYTPKQTNADRIRAMSDEELAEHFSELIKDTRKNEYCIGVGDWLLWLQSEAE